MRRGSSLALGTCLALTLGCGSEDVPVDEDSGTSEDEASESEASSAEATGTDESTSTTGDTTGSTTGDGDGDGDGDGEPADLARGISISRVEANPGVGIPLSIDGRESTFAERYTRLPARRPMWVLIDVDVEDGWEPREIEARITLHRPGGDTITASQVQTITRDTQAWKDDPDGGHDSITELRDYAGFHFGLPAEEMVPDIGWSLSLHEVDPSYLDQPVANPAPILPPVGGEESWPIGIENSNNVFRLVMVPIAMDYGSCQETPIHDEPTIKRYVDHLFASNPLEEVDYTIHEPYAWNSSISSSSDLSAILNAMSQLKSQEQAGPEVYYYALINNCGTCISGGGMGCIVGQARLPGDGMDGSDALNRVGSGLLSTSTFVHELGHAQGRRHIECEGAGAAGTDPAYPYNNGILGSWGFDMRELFVHHPDLGYDYMSYCGPSWVSNWQWEETWKRIATLSSWGDVSHPEGPLWVVHVDDEGRASSWTTQGWLEHSRSADGDVARFQGPNGLRPAQPVRVTETAHGAGLTFMFEAPQDADALESLTLSHAGRDYLIPASNLPR